MENIMKSEESRPAVKLDKKDISKTFVRWWFTVEMGENFERMQALVFCGSLGPVLRKLYHDDSEKLKEALKRHLTFFNTEGMFGGVILGTVIAMEEQKANGEDVPEESIVGFKTGLMGPMAGLGDSIDWATLAPLGRAAGAGMALAGNVLAPLATITVSIIQFLIGYNMTMLGYNLGRESVKKIFASGLVKEVISGANIIGLFMIGALTASYVKLSTAVEFDASGTVVNLQNILDGIAPGLLQLAAIFGVYWALKFKKFRPAKVVISILILSILASFIGLF